MPYSTVRNHCLRVIGQSTTAIGKHASAKKIQKTRTPMPIDKCFKAEHVDFLVGEECLRQWSGLSLKRYVDLFHTVPIDVKTRLLVLRILYRRIRLMLKSFSFVKTTDHSIALNDHTDANSSSAAT